MLPRIARRVQVPPWRFTATALALLKHASFRHTGNIIVVAQHATHGSIPSALEPSSEAFEDIH